MCCNVTLERRLKKGLVVHWENKQEIWQGIVFRTAQCLYAQMSPTWEGCSFLTQLIFFFACLFPSGISSLKMWTHWWDKPQRKLLIMGCTDNLGDSLRLVCCEVVLTGWPVLRHGSQVVLTRREKIWRILPPSFCTEVSVLLSCCENCVRNGAYSLLFWGQCPLVHWHCSAVKTTKAYQSGVLLQFEGTNNQVNYSIFPRKKSVTFSCFGFCTFFFSKRSQLSTEISRQKENCESNCFPPVHASLFCHKGARPHLLVFCLVDNALVHWPHWNLQPFLLVVRHPGHQSHLWKQNPDLRNYAWTRSFELGVRKDFERKGKNEREREREMSQIATQSCFTFREQLSGGTLLTWVLKLNNCRHFCFG